jgi:nucleotide-binding universal stress UspA family protein
MAVLGAVASWNASFGGPPPWLVEVVPVPKESPDFGDAAESSDVHRLATHLKEMGVDAEWEVTRAKHPTDALIDFADRIADAVLVVASARWTDADHSHLRSVARRLAHEAHHPVLVVRADRLPPA